MPCDYIPHAEYLPGDRSRRHLCPGNESLLPIPLHPEILDIQSSEMNGAAVVRRLRQLEQASILVLSARYSRLEEIEVLNAGSDAYLPVEGPLDQELLLAHASALMRRYLSINTKDPSHRTRPENQSGDPKSLPERGKSPSDSEAV